MFTMKQGLADCRKAYEEKRLQFFAPRGLLKSASIHNGCTYFKDYNGTCFVCAVGAMLMDFKDTIIEYNLNEETSANSLMHSGHIDNNLTPDEIYDLTRLQNAHDNLTDHERGWDCGQDLNEDDARYYSARKAELVANFNEVLTRLEEKYV